MAPVVFRGELLLGVLGVVDEKIHPVAQVEHGVGNRPEVTGSLVVAHIGE